MGWNNSTGERKIPSVVSKPHQNRHLIYWGCLGIVLVIGTILLLLCHEDENEPSVSEQATNKPKEPLQAISSITSQPLPKIKNKPVPQTNNPFAPGGSRSVAITNGCVVTYPNDKSVIKMLPRPEDKLPFKHFPDNEIASIISIKPGMTAIVVPLPRNFDERFKASLKEPIEINADDDEKTVALKKDVIEARKILADAMAHGESPREILIEERKNLNRLMGIRDNYQKMVREAIRESATAEEVDEIVNVANKMLQEKGIENPIRLPYHQRIRLERNKYLEANKKESVK